jgi:hypothetical protein
MATAPPVVERLQGDGQQKARVFVTKPPRRYLRATVVFAFATFG